MTDDFGKMPAKKKFRRREWRDGRNGSNRTFISPQEMEQSMRHPTWTGEDGMTKEWKVSFTVPGPNFLQKMFVDFIQWLLGDRVLIIDRSRILDTEKYQSELERLWSEREEGTISKPTVIQLKIALDDEETEDGRPATGSTRS